MTTDYDDDAHQDFLSMPEPEGDDQVLDLADAPGAVPTVTEPEQDYIVRGANEVRVTYRAICRELDELRDDRERINARIAELVEAEQLWKPLVHRLDNGIPRRTTD